MRSSPSNNSAIDDVADLIRNASHVACLTGAGISTESGIPDFRGPQGVWTKNPEAARLSDISSYIGDPEVRRRSWQVRLNSPLWNASPNSGHESLVALERKGKLQTLVTQNIDGLHQMAGSSPEIVVEIHGTAREVKCLGCKERAPMSKALERVKAGEQDPPCRSCGGILKSATISFGEALEASDLERSFLAAEQSDLMIAIGTSLAVTPAADLPAVALRNGAKLVVINAEETPYDRVAEHTLRQNIAEVLPAIVGRV